MDTEKINNMFNLTGGHLSSAHIMTNITTALILGLVLFYIYRKTYTGVSYSYSFNVTMLLVSLVTSSIIMVIGNNLTLSLGMVGALSIVRFRTAIKDPKDIAFLFWAISTGIATGAGELKIAIITHLSVGLLLLVLYYISKKLAPYTLAITASYETKVHITNLIHSSFPKARLLSESVEHNTLTCIYEVQAVKNREEAFSQQMRDSFPEAHFQLVANETTLGL